MKFLPKTILPFACKAPIEEYLDTLNNDILQLRDKRIKRHESNKHSLKQRKKDALLEENKGLKSAYDDLLKKNASK